MAAKVVMVAVPAVLGIASIKVQPVDVNMKESLSLEKLSIYTPLPPTHRLQFIDEQPGALQRSLSSLRAGLLPYIQTAQGACVSWKNVTVNLYHGSVDVYYYLKDPPPGFLPRLGSIYLAGLVGMLVTRNAGSRLRRIVVPTSLMAAGVSVCFPAQTVTLLKVTGRKLQAAGQWSGAAVSSLLLSRDPAPSQAAEGPARSGPEEEEEEDPPGSDPAPPRAGPAPPTRISDSELLAAFLVAVPPIPPDPAVERPGISPDPVMMDYGQSNPEDSDMYSTRS